MDENNINVTFVLISILILSIIVYIQAGILVVIIGGSGIIAFIAWLLTTYKKDVESDKILPLFLLVVAAELFHQMEEVIADFPGEVSSLMGIEVDFNFAILLFLGLGVTGTLTAVGLLYDVKISHYFVWFVIIGPGMINFVAHVGFAIIAGGVYFPGLLTVILPTIPGVLLIKKILQETRN